MLGKSEVSEKLKVKGVKLAGDTSRIRTDLWGAGIDMEFPT